MTMPTLRVTATATAIAVTAATAIALVVYQRRRRRKDPPGPTIYGELRVRHATEADLPHLKAISAVAGQAIVPADVGGGDFITAEWQTEWWTLDPQLHWNDFAFVGETAVAFARVEAYGAPSHPDSGWLMGMRVRPEHQGKRVMARLQAHLLARIPRHVRANLYLGIGSTNAVMRSICDLRYEFYGAYVLHEFMPGAMLRADRERYAAALSIDHLESAALDAAWEFLTTHGRPAVSRGSADALVLLVPGRFYDFQALTRRAIADKIATRRAIVARDGGGAIVAFFVEFDSFLDGDGANGPGVRRIYTCCAAADLEAAKVGSALLAFGRSQPATDAPSGLPLRTVLSVGPWADEQGRDVDPRMAIALTGGNYTRTRSTHLRLYRVP